MIRYFSLLGDELEEFVPRGFTVVGGRGDKEGISIYLKFPLDGAFYLHGGHLSLWYAFWTDEEPKIRVTRSWNGKKAEREVSWLPDIMPELVAVDKQKEFTLKATPLRQPGCNIYFIMDRERDLQYAVSWDHFSSPKRRTLSFLGEVRRSAEGFFYPFLTQLLNRTRDKRILWKCEDYLYCKYLFV